MDDIFAWLLLRDEEFLKYVNISVFKASGRGGQKVNKTSSAVRMVFEPLNVEVTCQKYRKQTENKLSALRKLRKSVALHASGCPSDDVFAICVQYIKNGLHINRKNRDISLIYALIVSLFCNFNGDHKKVAVQLGVTSSRLVKFLAEDKLLLNKVNSIRNKADKNNLKV